MGYDRQRSPFATRLLLTCYCLFLLINVLLHTTYVYQKQKDHDKFENHLDIISLAFIGLLVFSISFYGIWFAKIFILFCFAFLLSVLLATSFISLIVIIIKFQPVNTNKFLSLKTSIYFVHNFIWLAKTSTFLSHTIHLLISCLLNTFALWGIFHLCTCIEYRH